MDSEGAREVANRPMAGIAARGLALVGAVVMASVLALAGPASAESTSPVSNIAPAAQDVESVSLLAAAPTITPAADDVWHSRHRTGYSCPAYTLCVAVWDPTYGDGDWYKIFELYTCNLYHLSNWFGTGTVRNNSSPGTDATFYEQYYNPRYTIAPDYPTTHYVFWDPVWHIDNCT